MIISDSPVCWDLIGVSITSQLVALTEPSPYRDFQLHLDVLVLQGRLQNVKNTLCVRAHMIVDDNVP